MFGALEPPEAEEEAARQGTRQGPSADGDVGAELTRPLDKSECWSLPAKLQGLPRGRVNLLRNKDLRPVVLAIRQNLNIVRHPHQINGKVLNV